MSKRRNNSKKPKLDICTECDAEIDGFNITSAFYKNRIVCTDCYYFLTNNYYDDAKDDAKDDTYYDEENGDNDECETCNNAPSKINLFANPPIIPNTTSQLPPVFYPLPPFSHFPPQQNTSNTSATSATMSPVENGDKPNLRFIFTFHPKNDDTQNTNSIPEDATANKTSKRKQKNKSESNSQKRQNTEKKNDPIDFFSAIIRQLNNIDNPQHPSSISGNEGNDTKDNDEEDQFTEENYPFEWLGPNIKNIDNLIALGEKYDPKIKKRYNLNLKKLNSLVEPLKQLRDMIGMENVKKIIFDQLIYYLQCLDDKNTDMLHTVITGPPGVGKTQLTHIIAKIYNRLGFLKTDNVICVKRDDLIGEYIGQTAVKTRKVLEKSIGGVLLIDEAYSLTPTSEKDFARECIDLINMFLSEHAHEMACIIAGYKKPIYEKFFTQNEGLARRFTHHFDITGYNSEELALIFRKYVKGQNWDLSISIEDITQFIQQHLADFPHFGGDMTTLFACCKKSHSKRLLMIETEEQLLASKKKLSLLDIEDGFKIFCEIKAKNGEDENDRSKYIHMYS